MIHIYTDKYQQEILDAASRLEGLVDILEVLPIASIDDRFQYIIVDKDTIQTALPWSNEEPPVLFRWHAYNINDLISIVLSKLGYEEEALNLTSNELLKEEIKSRIQLKNPDKLRTLSHVGEDYIALHNRAVINHYSGHFHNGIGPDVLYKEAIALAPSDEHKAFTAKQFAVLLMDQGAFAEAEALLRKYEATALSDQAKSHLNLDLIQILMTSASFRATQQQLEETKKLLWDTLQYFEQKEIFWAVATLYSQASEIANYEQSYAEALGYINKTVDIYQEQGFPEFLASAYMQKGTVLYSWAQDGNPQFYQPAIDTYQEALKFFDKQSFPHIYIEIQHYMAVIYAEMPADEKKKAMWAAFSATSFKECLDFYKRQDSKYEYAMVANNYANALLKYPPTKTGDNIEKAVGYHMEALEIRTPDEFPEERAHSILNYLEACWRAHNINKTMERARYRDMIAKAKEIKSLTSNQELISQAQGHLDQLNSLAISILRD